MSHESLDQPDDDLARYTRQMRLPSVGVEGQRRLSGGTALVIGCGALGSLVAEWLVRAGVGKVRLVDRDFIELHNLQRQTLYTEQDVADNQPKAIAAANRLRQINSTVEIEPIVADVTADNIESLCTGADVLVDGLDNFEARFVVNDAAAKLQLPWVFGSCIGGEGQSLTILPGAPPCLRCVIGEPPPPASMPTCDTAGVLGPVVGVVASIEAAEAIKILSGNIADVNRRLYHIDLLTNEWRQLKLESLAERGCPTCRREEYPWLAAGAAPTVTLCGRDSVQVRGTSGQIDLEVLRSRWHSLGTVSGNAHLSRLKLPEHTLTVFADGRAIIGGTQEAAVARSLYARYVGN